MKYTSINWKMQALLAAVFAAISAGSAVAAPVTLAGLVAGGTVTSGDKVFFEFHNVTQVGDINVPLDEIFVDPILGGPGAVEVEYGIRFSSALWSLTGPGLSYDIGIDFHVRQSARQALITDNTLEFTGGVFNGGTIRIAEGVIDHATRVTLANKFVFADSTGAKLEDHQVFPGGPYVELEISKDFAMTTGQDQQSRAFVSHFDQTFSQKQVPEGGVGATAALALAGLVGFATINRKR